MNQTSPIEIRMASIEDIKIVIEHDIIHMKELGHNNLPSHPFLPTHQFDLEDMIHRKMSSWSKEPKTQGFGRSFIALDKQKVVGHLNIKTDLETSTHRVHLGMGIEYKYRNLKIGTQLLNECIQFCRLHYIEYIDLSVFGHNAPAIKLYTRFGFEKIGTYKDKFRMGNTSIDDIIMSLKL
jgi:ribosomal protein S18 acetylase RimI-like enzyme